MNSSYLPTNASWLPYHPMYVPVFQGQIGQQPLVSSRAHMRSISCQVTTIEESSDEELLKEKGRDKDNKGGTLGRTARSNSLGRNKDLKEERKTSKSGKGERAASEDIGEFKRSASLKYKGEKAKTAKDVNVKSGSANQEKEKGEKTSIFSKLFSRKKKDKEKDKASALMPPPPPPPPIQPPAPPTTASSDRTSEGKESKEKEYATFSAQFPPPEWLWYQQQLEKQKRTETWVSQQSSKVTNVTQSSKVTARPPTGSKSHAVIDHRHHNGRMWVGQHPHVDYMPMSAVSSQKDKRVISNDPATKQEYDGDFLKPRSIRPDNLYESFRNPSSSKHRHHHHRKSRDFDKLDGDKKHSQRPSEYDVIDQGDATVMQESNVYHSVSALSPVAHLSDESTYAKLIEQPKFGGPLHSTPRYEGQADRTAYGVEGHEARDRIYGPPDNSHKRKSHRSRRRQHRVYSFYGNGDDISYEYKGHLPNKNSSRAQSRDSGVNCVGLGLSQDQQKKEAGPVYENTPLSNKYNHQVNHRHQNKHSNHPQNPSGNHVHFEVNDTLGNESTDTNCLYVTDPATASVVYQSDVTNSAAYNSVVYGSNVTDNIGGPSVMYHTINTDVSDMPLPQNSFYDESSLAVPSSNLITCQAEINPKAPQDIEELHCSPESVIDVVGSPSAREVSGSSNGVVELVNDDGEEEEVEVAAGSGNEDNVTSVECRDGCRGRDEQNGCDGDDNDVGDGDGVQNKRESDQGFKNTNGSSQRVHSNNDIGSHSNVPNSVERQGMGVANTAREKFVADSGFSSPRNPENPDRRAQTSGHSNSASEHSDGHPNHEDSGNMRNDQQENMTDSSNVHQLSGETTGSDGHHTNSDVYMATGSEHHSGSTNENDSAGLRAASPHDSGSKFSDGQRGQFKIRHSHSSNSIKSHNHIQHPPPHQQSHHHQQQQQQQQRGHQNLVHHYQPAAKMVPHPDVYNNNTGKVVYIDQGHPVRVPLHPNAMLNNQKPHTGKSKRTERPRSVDLWKSNKPSDLHKFEEEQLAKKYGVNGEFEVMGVL